MLRSIFSALYLALATIVWTIPVVATGLLTRSKRRAYTFIRIWAYCLIYGFGVRVTTRGQGGLSFEKRRLYLSNHVSQADIPILMTAIPAGLAFVSKESLARIPFLGWSMRMVGMVFITRSNTKNDLSVLNKAVGELAPDMNFMVFPEGTRRKGDPRSLGPVKKGGFYMARSLGCPIQPVAIVGSERVLSLHSIAIHGGPVEVRFGTPIEVGPESDIDELMAQFQAQMTELLRNPLPIKGQKNETDEAQALKRSA